MARTNGHRCGVRLIGAVLAGGRSSRFGSDKAAAMFGQASLLDHAVAALLRETETVVVIGREDSRFVCAPDRPALGLGPLGGIAGALGYGEAHGFEAVVTIACDTPLLPAGLMAALAGEGPAIVAEAPVIGYWPVALRAALDAHLAKNGDRSVRRWARGVGAREVVAPGPIPNVNRIEDLDALGRQIPRGNLTIPR